MATKTQSKAKAKVAPKAKAENGRKSVTNRMAKGFRAEKATFGMNDKRAQYARLVLFNLAVKEKTLSKDADINDPGINKTLEKVGVSLCGGNLLDGKEALEFISGLTAKGSTSGRPLTAAYAAEVRPFLKRLQLSDGFGNRGKGKKKEETKEEAPAAEASA